MAESKRTSFTQIPALCGNSLSTRQKPTTICDPEHTPLSFLTGRKAFPGTSPGRARQTASEEAPPAGEKKVLVPNHDI